MTAIEQGREAGVPAASRDRRGFREEGEKAAEAEEESEVEGEGREALWVWPGVLLGAPLRAEATKEGEERPLREAMWTAIFRGERPAKKLCTGEPSFPHLRTTPQRVPRKGTRMGEINLDHERASSRIRFRAGI